MQSYRDLKVWQQAIDLVPAVYRLFKLFPKEESYAMVAQIRRAAVSVPANIAEGYSRQHTKEFIQHISIARGSLAELDTLLIVAQKLEYLKTEDLNPIQLNMAEIRMMLHGLTKSLQSKL